MPAETPTPDSPTFDPGALREQFEARGQGHVFAHWDRLDAAGRERLAREAAAVDLDLVETLVSKLGAPGFDPAGRHFEPPEVFPLEPERRDPDRARDARERGAELLRAGRVGYLLVAGGQASRLGYDGPKGAFPVGPVSGRTLFEMFARRLRAAQRRHGAPTPWYVMTSTANDAATRAFFAEHDHFGLDPADVTFFSQAMLPALDREGRILLSAPDALFLAPNGHGGVLEALRTSGALDDLRRRGVETLSYFQVDNPLARPADELFLGLHALADAEMSTKVVAKTDPAEKVGVLGRVDGELACIEYSDLPDELRQARDDRGRLVFDAGNIAIHALQVDFVDSLTEGGLQLPWHLARKSMKVVDEAGGPAEREGVKFETFVFDALGRTTSSVVLEVDRAHEFSPVKNAEGGDSPATARRDLCRLFAGYVEAAGQSLPAPGPSGDVPVEVDPLLAESAEELAAAGPPAPREVGGGVLYDAPEER